MPIAVTELCEYAASVDISIARESIRAVGKIALQQYDVNAIVDRLLQFLEMEKDYVTAETLVHYCKPKTLTSIPFSLYAEQTIYLYLSLQRHQ